MGVRFPSVFTTTLLGTVPSNGAETIILTTPPLNLPLDGAQVFLGWYLTPTAGAGSTGAVVTIRRGALLTSPVVLPGPTGTVVTAGAGATLAGWWVDTPGIVGGQQYTLTVSGAGTTGAWTMNQGCLLAFVL